jgi:hypothetical protein
MEGVAGCKMLSAGVQAMLNCPHCGKPGISPLRKVILSPGLLATCKTCGKFSGIRYPSWLTAMIPGSVLMLGALLVSNQILQWTLNIVGFFMMIVVPFLFAPLRKES